MSGFVYKIVLKAHGSGNQHIIGFYTIRAARNWLREHPGFDIVELINISTGEKLSLTT